MFMPGLAEIKLLYEQLQSNRIFNNRRGSRFVKFDLLFSAAKHSQCFLKKPVFEIKLIEAFRLSAFAS